MIYVYGQSMSVYNGVLPFMGKSITSCSPGYDIILSASHLSRKAKAGDTVLFFDYEETGLFDFLALKGVNMLPKPGVSRFLRNRAVQLESLDRVSSFALSRVYVENSKGPVYCGEDHPVVKVGFNHHGDGKYLCPERVLTDNEPVVCEEFVEDALSVRVLFIDKATFLITQKGSSWIANKDPVVEKYYSVDSEKYTFGTDSLGMDTFSAVRIVKDASCVRDFLDIPIAGIDYVISKNKITGKVKIGFLEVNDMVGFPDYRPVYKAFAEFLNRLIKNKGNLK